MRPVRPLLLPFLLAVSCLAARAGEIRGTIFVGDGERPIRILRPPLERWSFLPSPEPRDPALFLSIVDAEWGSRVDFRSYPPPGTHEDPTPEDPADRLTRELAGELAPAGGEAHRPVREERSIAGRTAVIWTFEGRPATGGEDLGVVRFEVWRIVAGDALLVVLFRVPEPALRGRAKGPTEAALDYIRKNLWIPEEGGE
ncbi:MAG: hypothetical protein HY720_23035 [Planctomycetes bacterium]|nr:hypothetical protein [Planctomycetota bacterium]